MKQKDSRILRKRQRKLMKRLERKQYAEQSKPMLGARNICYEVSEKAQAIDSGGLGAFHCLAHNTGLIQAIDRKLHVLKRHLPYHESDHVLNIAYNTLTGGTCLDDIELRRNNETFMDAVGAERIPDPTTAGDFTRRFTESDVLDLMDAVNLVRLKVWKKNLKREEKSEAIIDLDGTMAKTTGECKEGMGLSHKGVWGYHPLLVSLANTMEPLYLVNRSGNRPSHDGSVEWIDRSVAMVKKGFERVCLRGDTDFSLTKNFDRWTEDEVRFAFGMDAMPHLLERVEDFQEKRWRPMKRREKRAQEGTRRKRPENVKEKIVKEKKYKNIKLQSEHVAEFSHKPLRCSRSYRVIVLRKNLSVERGESVLFDDIRYLFYITNIEELSPSQIVTFCNERCNQENLIEQLKNGINALRMPVRDLVSNWAYMVMASLAWTLKAWFALFVGEQGKRKTLLFMEYRRFLNGIVRIPAQIVRKGRRLWYRLLGYNEWIATFLRTFDTIRNLRMT